MLNIKQFSADNSINFDLKFFICSFVLTLSIKCKYSNQETAQHKYVNVDTILSRTTHPFEKSNDRQNVSVHFCVTLRQQKH